MTVSPMAKRTEALTDCSSMSAAPPETVYWKSRVHWAPYECVASGV